MNGLKLKVNVKHPILYIRDALVRAQIVIAHHNLPDHAGGILRFRAEGGCCGSEADAHCQATARDFNIV
jgi:hypothetical protein